MSYDYPMFELGWQRALLWASFILFLGSLLLRQESAITQDLGRHLRLGEMIVAGDSRKCALLFQLLNLHLSRLSVYKSPLGVGSNFYLIHKWSGFSGIIVFKAVVLGLAFAITLLHSLNSIKARPFKKAWPFMASSYDYSCFSLRPNDGGPPDDPPGNFRLFIVFSYFFWF